MRYWGSMSGWCRVVVDKSEVAAVSVEEDNGNVRVDATWKAKETKIARRAGGGGMGLM